jgi:hypothetical protein
MPIFIVVAKIFIKSTVFWVVTWHSSEKVSVSDGLAGRQLPSFNT